MIRRSWVAASKVREALHFSDVDDSCAVPRLGPCSIRVRTRIKDDLRLKNGRNCDEVILIFIF